MSSLQVSQLALIRHCDIFTVEGTKQLRTGANAGVNFDKHYSDLLQRRDVRISSPALCSCNLEELRSY